MNLERSVDNLAKRLDRLDPVSAYDSNTGLNHWKGKPIIPAAEWIELRNTPCALDCFPDDFNQDLIYKSEGELNEEQKQENVKKWDSDFLELIEYKESKLWKAKVLSLLIESRWRRPNIYWD